MASPMGTPAAAGTTPARGGFSFLSGLRKTSASPTPSSPGSPAPSSPTGSLTPTSARARLIPSFSHGLQKRQVIKELEEQTSLLRLQVHQQGTELNKLHQAFETEQAARVSLQERLNMQFFKANLLVDMMVFKLMDSSPPAPDARGSAASAVSDQTPAMHAAAQLGMGPTPAAALATAVDAVLAPEVVQFS